MSPFVLGNIIVAAWWFIGAGFFWALADIFDDPIRYETSFFRKWPERYFLRNLSQWNRWRQLPTGEPVVKRWNKKNKPIYFERFTGSSTLLAWVCDGFGLARFLADSCTCAAAASLTGLFGGGFWLVFVIFRLVAAITRHVWADTLTRK